MSNRAVRLEHFRAARMALAGALGTMDRKARTCASCGLKKHANFSEYQAAVEIEAMIRKLDRFTTSASIGGGT